MTANNQNAFSEITQANATLSRYNSIIPSEMSALCKMMARLAYQVYTMAMTNNNSDGIGIKQNIYVHRLQLPSA